MISKKVKKVMSCMAIATCLLGVGVTSYADTSYFTLTVTNNGAAQDKISLRTAKEDREQKCYVTTTGFNADNSASYMFATSCKLYDTGVCTDTMILNRKAVNSTITSKYGRYAEPNQYYFLSANHGFGSSTMHAEGRYTP